MFRIRSFFKELEPTRQMSEAFRNCIFLALSGGFQDAYTYFTRDGVFANAQTGNVVLMSTNFMTGKWGEGLKYLFPILAFALGVLVADLIQKKFKYFKKIHWRQGILLFEIIILFAVGFMPKSMDTVAAVIVSFSCAMQVQTFRKVNGYGYASTMCIGNLRSGTESLSVYLRDKEPGALRKAMHYYGIIIIFALGAGAGGVCTLHLGFKSIWISSALLMVAHLMMYKEKR